MDIEIPPELQWVSYLAGGEWPQGSETRTRRMGEHYQTAAEQLQDLIPELNQVRGETLSVLFGDTADAAGKQFAMLFDGDYAVDKLVTGISAMGEGATNFGTEIEYSKLSIIVGLALAAAEISWCLANAAPTYGASTALIPVIEQTTVLTIRQIVMAALRRLLAKMRELLSKTMMNRLFRREMLTAAVREAGQELAQGLTQEGIVQGIQAKNGHAGWRFDRFKTTAIASTVGGGAGGAAALPMGAALGPARNRLTAATKGATVMFTAGVVGNVAGTMSVGGEFDTLAILASSTSTSIGGLKGAGLASPNTGNNNTDPAAATRSEPPNVGLRGDNPDAEFDTGKTDNDEEADHKAGLDAQDDSAGPGVAPSAAAPGRSGGGQTNNVAPQPDSKSTSRNGERNAAIDESADHDTAESTEEADAETADTPAESADDQHTSNPQQDNDNPADIPADEPAHTAGLSAEPDAASPSADVPATDVPQAAVAAEPVAAEPVAAEPVVTEPLAAEPVAAEPAVAEPATVDAAADVDVAQQNPAPEAPAQQDPVQQDPAQQDPVVSGAPAAAPTTSAVAPATAPTSVNNTPSTPEPAAKTPAAKPDSKPEAAKQAPPVAQSAGPDSQVAGVPAARVQETAAQAARESISEDNPPTSVTPEVAETGGPARGDQNCVFDARDDLSAHFHREYRVAGEPSATGMPARALYEAARSRAGFATYAEIETTLRGMEPGSAAIIASAWAGDAQRQGGHAYVAVYDGKDVHLLRRGQRSGWPPFWGESAVSTTAVGYLDSQGDPVHELGVRPDDDLAAAIAVGDVQGTGDQAPGEQWRDVTPQSHIADEALAKRVPPVDVAELRNPLGLMEAADARARANATWWAGLTGAEQRALIDVHPQHIGNAEGIPPTARHAANTHALDEQRRQLQSWQDSGQRLSRTQSGTLGRLDRIHGALTDAGARAHQAGLDGPMLLAFDASAFGGDGRAIVSFGADPYQADSVSWHVPGQGTTIDRIGACMDDALNHLQSTRQDDSELSTASIAWLGYDAPSGWSSWRAAGHRFAREGGAILYSDIRAFNAARDTWAGDGSHFTGNDVFAHAYGTTATSYAGRDGRLANDIRTVTLTDSPGTGPVRHASEFGIGADNVHVASSPDPFTALGGRTPIVEVSLGLDPSTESFGAGRGTVAPFEAVVEATTATAVETTKQIADAALAQRVPPVDVDDVVNPLGVAENARTRAADNARWWSGLSDAQRSALIETYPRQIGNAEGIPPTARDAANRTALQHARNQKQGKLDRGEKLAKQELNFLRRMNRLDAGLKQMAREAAEAGIDAPLVLAFDPPAFGGDGRAVVSFGADPYQADAVSWLVPGFATTIDKLEGNMRNALNHLQSTLQENPTLAATSIAWIGYDAPNDSATPRVARATLAREGAEILYSDIRAFNAARDTMAGDGSHFSSNHIFAHSYGSTTASYAGRNARLANDIRTVTLLGSPGAGPLQHASDFGIGAENVFVASSSLDPVTGLGGRTLGQAGRFLGRGLGLDPAMDTFGAVRVTAQFPASMNNADSVGTHRSYYRYMDGDAVPRIRTESLANFGRIAAGHAERLHTEEHRRAVDGRTVEPAHGRALRLDGDTETDRPGDRRRWNPRWHPGEVEPSAAQVVADEALGQRIPPLAVGDLVQPLGSERQAVARARNNAAWWSGLSQDQQQALREAYPFQIGNAEGIPAADRDTANRIVVQRYLGRAADIQAQIDAGTRPTDTQLDFLLRVNRLESAFQRADAAAQQAGVDKPLILAFDPPAFGSDGRVLVSFGADPYVADSVSWYVPGMGAQINKLDYIMHCALNILQSTHTENPSLSAASIAWLGYDAPNNSGTVRVGRPGLARTGGDILHADISAFNAARDAFAGDGSHFTGNHVFGHSYGSTATSYAGAGGRLAQHVSTITLIGSPGAGPLAHARDFGIGTDNVFVASSSRDFVTGIGGRTSDSHGRMGIGLGTDPAMDTFGAQRVSAEFPASMDRKDTTATHNAYFDFQETDGPGTRQWLVTPAQAVRTEALANLGRIAAGHTERLHHEPHRTTVERPGLLFGTRSETVEPAAARNNSQGRNWWNPRWRDADVEVDHLHAVTEPDWSTTENGEQTHHQATRAVADAALAQRVPPVGVADVVNPLGVAGDAMARARDNARWWAELTEQQRNALVETYPARIGNAEGIPPVARDAANRRAIQGFRDRVQSMIDRGVRPGKNDLANLLRVNRLDAALQAAALDAAQAGIGRPMVLALDPFEFNGDGRAVVSFGADPYQADSVSWLVPGFATTVDKLAGNMRNALNHVQSTMREDPTLAATSIAWIGYDAPNDSASARVLRPGLARAGAEILYSDIRAFNVARDTVAADGSHFRGNHIFAHSYGSTTASYAGRNGRLARDISTVTLLGSPGAGPMRHARDFGIGADRVFVAASSRDPVTGFGGRTPGQDGRFAGRGLGMDPAMNEFGAVRVTAQFPDAMNTRSTFGTHKSYHHHVADGDGPPVRTESVANFGRIAAGHTDRLHLEEHRRVVDGRTVEPAAGRALRLDSDNQVDHEGRRNRWNPRGHPGEVEPSATRRVADEALRQRVPPLAVKDLVHPLGSERQAVARARNNAAWWSGLTGEQRAALVEAYPHQIGNAEGIPAAVRDNANREMLRRYAERAAAVQTKLDAGEKLTNHDLDFLRRVNRLESAMQRAEVAAQQAGVGHPLLLALQPGAFGGDGRALVSFGADPYMADSVSWYVPGLGSQLDKLDYITHCALNILQSTRTENPSLSAASIAWLGYDAPNDSASARVARPGLARAGGEMLYTDISTFNAVHDAFAGDGSHFTGNHVFGHSYGSTTTSYAGANGRLARHITTVTLIGSPGAGPLHHAGDFGISTDRVFVASSSRDFVTGLGGRTSNSQGRFGIGLGTDPAMDTFGAQRISAEFPASMDRKDTLTTHNAYFDFLETDGPGTRQWLVTPSHAVRTESLTNFGRIAAGDLEAVHSEPHRTVDGNRSRTTEPAATRPFLRMDDDLGTPHPADPHNRRAVPRWNRDSGCAHIVADEVSTLTGREIRLDAAPSRRGVPARALFQAVQSSAGFATYAEVNKTLLGMPSGSIAILASQWSGGQPVGHAYFAVRIDNEVYLFDPHTRQYSKWPPYWGQAAVSQTAVGYLRSNGEAVQRGRWHNQLAAAAIGRVQGLPDGHTVGITAGDRDTANRAALQHYRERADNIRTKVDQFGRVSREERAFLDRIDRLDLAVRKADADAARAGLDAPLVLVLDTSAFNGNGHAVISFGADPYHADTVTWQTARGSIDQLGTVTARALDGLTTGRRPDSAAAIAWIGADTAVLHRHLAAFHATRKSFGQSEPFTGNRVVTQANGLWVEPDGGTQVVAHRGASHDFPEQTRAAYTEALRQGAQALECDVRLTKDGQLVLIHDKTVDRTSNGTGRVGDMTLAELQALDYAGHGILTLDEFMQLALDADRPVRLFIETKHPAQQGWKIEREVVAVLERHGLAKPTPDQKVSAAVISFYPDALVRVRSAAPNLPTVLLGPTARYLASVVGASAIGPSIETLRSNPELVGAAAARGLATYCWTVNNQADVQFARDLGVAWVATDHPGRTDTWLGDTAAQQESGPALDNVDNITETIDRQAVAQVADEALSRRIPPVRPDELRNPLGPVEEATARAANNARWWSGLTEAQRDALVETYPQHIGNSEGIGAADRDRANRQVLQQMREQADAVQSKLDRGERTSSAERKLLRRMDRLDLALRKASVDAAQAGVDGPLLVAFDPKEFGGDGRAVLSYGADPYTADSVSWHVPGVESTVDSMLGFNTTSALNHLLAVRQENPGLSAASIAWIGYDNPSGLNILRAAGHGMARTAGDVLYSDIRAFNAARDTLAGDGSRFTGNHIFGYSYGSTTMSYAGQNGRLAGQVRTVSLIGSPGTGPVRHAGEFGIGADNVFVASSSRDLVTALGGRTADPNGRVFGIGLGTDPAMDSFGAVRVTAEPPAAMNRLLTGGTHHAYFLSPESSTNFGRIAAGHSDRVVLEQHRTEMGRDRNTPLLRTVEPAADRVGGRRFWNPLWRQPPNCAVTVTEELSSIFDRKFQLDARPSRRGVPARALFEAVRADTDFATYDEVKRTLLGDPALSVAVLTSQWSGGRQAGHAYLAVKIEKQVYLYDPHTKKYSPWPPHWGQHAVTQTAVGYLRTNGDPVGPMTADVPLQLDAAEEVGKVQGPQRDSEFSQRQAEYRAQDPTTRLVDTRYAEPLGDVVDNASDRARVRQLARDLSGRYGPYRIALKAENLTDVVLLTGDIFDGDKKIGTISRQFNRDPDGTLVAAHTGLVIEDKQLRGKGFSKALTAELERFYVHSGVDRIELTTHDKGAFAWARRGYAWDPGTRQLQESLDRVKMSADQLRDTVSDEARALLDQVVQQLDPRNPRLPEPIDLANLATTAEPDLGRRLLDGTGAVHGRNGVHYVKYLDPASVAPARTGLKGWLQNLFGRDGASRGNADGNCAYGVAGEMSTFYGRPFDLSIAPSSTGVPAWALFEAAQSRSQFATYADIENDLLGRPARSSAIVVSRWASGGERQGGHAYWAVTDGKRVRLYDPDTREYSPWPPHWGEAAIDRIAVGYLDENGAPVHRIGDEPVQISLHAADNVGDVRGHPEYRDQDRATRTVDTRHAEPLGDVINESADQAQAQRLADDLSGVYGPYRVQFSAEALPSAVQLTGEIFNGDKRIGEIDRIFIRDDTGKLVAHHNEMKIEDKELRGKGFSKAFLSEFDRYYARSGVDRIELLAVRDGAYAWARRGFSWDLRTDELQESLDSVKVAAQRLLGSVNTEARVVLEEVIGRLEPGHPRLPEPADLANLTAPGHPELGRDVLRRTSWYGVKYVDETPGYRSPDDVELAGFWDRIGQLDQGALSPEALADAVYRPVPIDAVTGFYEGRVSGFKTSEVLRAQQHVDDTLDNAFFVSADIANLRGLNQASADRTEANAHFSALSAIFSTALHESGADVVPMRIGGDELGAVVVGDIDESTIESAIATIRARAQQYAREHGLADIPHPKHPGQPEYNGVGLHIGYAGVQPDLDVRDIFDDADLGVDRSKTRRSNVAGGPGRATGIDRADTAGEATPGRGDGTRIGSQAAGSESQVASRAGTEGQAGQRLSARPPYQQPEDLKRASFLVDAARLGAEGRSALQALYEPLGRDEVSGFYDGRASEFKTGEVARARQWVTESGETGVLVSAQLDNLSGLNAHVQNRAEVANAHYRAITEIFRAEIEATGATVVPMRTSGDRFDAVVIGAIDPTAVDAALDRIDSRTATYVQNEGVSDIANPSNAGRPGLRLFFGYSDLTSHGSVDEVIQAAEGQMFARQDAGDTRRVAEPDVDIPSPRLPYTAADAVGDVQGLPGDSEFLSRQQEYRNQDPAGRPADSRYAEPVGDVVDNSSDPQRVHQLAEDLSGVYGPFRVELQRVPDEATGIAGRILSDGKQVGIIYWSYHRDGEGNLVAFHGMIEITRASHRGKGFSKALAKQLEPFYARSGVDRIEMEAAWDGAYAWASWGFSWAPELAKLQESLNSIKGSAQRLRPQLGPEAQAVLDEVVQRLDPDHPRLPDPIDLARLTAPGHTDLGRRLLTNTNWHAVRYLDPDAGDVIGDVQGYPEGAEFLARQQEYRNQDPATRQADTSYADHLAEAVDSYDRQDARQLAEDLSGRYGPYHVEFSVERAIGGESVSLYGLIRSGDTGIGYVSRKFSRDDDGNLVVENTIGRIEDAQYRGHDFSKALTSELERFYARCGVDRIELMSKWQGSNAWARRGFTWTTDPYHLDESLNHIKDAARQLRDQVGTESQRVLDDIVERLDVGHPRLPEPIDLANLATSEEPQLGRKLLDNTSVHFVKYLPSLPSGDLQAAEQNCAHGVADVLSDRYKREFRVAVEPSRTGVPARALYEAVGSGSRFATYDQVEAALRQLGDGSSAVLTSRWRGGRSGGHAYLAVNDGREIYLLDPKTGERTGWPPHWGQAAVDRTAVGYLDANGDAVNPLHDVPLRLGTAESVGDVRGLPAEPSSPEQVADEALTQRNPAVDATELVRPTGDAQLAVERAQANAAWWKGLTEVQQQAVIETYPRQIGNAEGIPPMAAHEANSRAMQDWLAKGREMQSKLDSGVRLGWEKHLEMLRAKAVGDALDRATDAARRAGIDGPYLLRFDPDAHRGAGVAVVGFGVDPYLAESVSWHVPGRGMTIQELGPGMGSALNHAMSVLIENPTESVASMTWIAYDTMADDAAQVGGENLHSDISGFNAGRDAWSAERFNNNHVFGHCQGSTVAGFAGEGGRLGGQLRTVTLFGSPGLGPMDHAGEFGRGVDVYVASSSTDVFTWRGGITPGSMGSPDGGYGVDPAMDFFGAQRITAEFPLVEMTRAGDYDIHNFYYKFVDKSAGVRNESLANFGRIATGHVERVGFEDHRTVVTGPDQETKVRDPAVARSVQLDDLGLPDADPAENCAYGVAEVVSQRYGRDIRIETAVTATGVPARSLFEAVGSRAEFATYAEVAQELARLGPGSSAVLASRWTGVRQGGHAYLAVNDGDQIYLIDRRTGQRSGWPPHWGHGAVDRTAVGYLDEHGNAVAPLGDPSSQLAAAQAVGDVRGLPADPEFLRRQQEYRTQDSAARAVDTQYAQPFGDLLESGDLQGIQQLAADLSGRYGPYRVEFQAEPDDGRIALSGSILSGESEIGWVDWSLERDASGDLIAYNGMVEIYQPDLRGKGFSKAMLAQLEPYFIRAGVDRIELTSDLQGSNAWARRGFTWGPDLSSLQGALDQIKIRAQDLREQVSPEARTVLDEMVARLEVDNPRLPEPIDLANLGTAREPHLGRRLLDNTSIDFVKYLPSAPADPLAPLGLPHHAPGTLAEGEAITAFTDGELRLRALNEELVREGVTAEDRARQLTETRNALRSWAYGLMTNRVAADWLSANTANPTFEELVARNEERGLTGDAVYDAIVETATHSRLAPGSLSDIETGAVYSQFELGLRALGEQMIRDEVSIEDRARTLAGLRSSLRAWTRELMENRPAADWLSANESAPTFEDLVARYEAKGLTGDDVYQAIIDGATHSHYGAGTLSDEETRTVYTTFELRMRELREQLLRDGVGAEERARTLYGMRATIRSWTRSLMEDRRLAEWLNANEPSPTFDELVAKNRGKGLVGDEIYEAIIASSTRSRGSVNAELGIDPDNPPELPPMRGPGDPREDTEEDSA